MSLAPGTRLGPYEILALLGAGGMGEVYRAHDPRLGREVAIKVLPAGLSADPDRLRRFDQEARAAAALNHRASSYVQPSHRNIHRMPADGGPLQPMTRFPEAGLLIEEPTISPDGRYLVDARGHGGSSLWMLTRVGRVDAMKLTFSTPALASGDAED